MEICVNTTLHGSCQKENTTYLDRTQIDVRPQHVWLNTTYRNRTKIGFASTCIRIWIAKGHWFMAQCGHCNPSVNINTCTSPQARNHNSKSKPPICFSKSNSQRGDGTRQIKDRSTRFLASPSRRHTSQQEAGRTKARHQFRVVAETFR